MSRGASAFERLMIVMMQDLACCTQLPNGLCHLPCLKFFQVMHAPAIKRVGPKFMTIRPSSSQHHHGAHQLSSIESFASLVKLELQDNPDLERVTSLPKLQKLIIVGCPKMRALEGVPELQGLEL
uniref:NB-ARC domain-containing protein n=1 Tax=Oryza barthii TaxID=65489 RepID=A0A0D3G537_9ORYZ